MEIRKPNDILVATLSSPTATTQDMLSVNINPDNTSLLTQDEYKQSPFIQNQFKTADGKFDDIKFNDFYNLAKSHYYQMTDDEYLKDINTVYYSPFDVSRPKNANTFKIDVEFEKDFNPSKQLFSRTGINSITENDFTQKQLAQQNKLYDPKTDSWSTESVNDLGVLQKLFGDTLVYATYNEDGTHFDPLSQKAIKHQKGEWKVDKDGNYFIEKLGDGEIYGKIVVNPNDILTTDGTLADKYNVFDADEKDKSLAGIGVKVAAEIAPFLIPGVGTVYGGIRAAVTMASILPTFYKSLEGMLLGEKADAMGGLATSAENYMAKFVQQSVSEEGSKSALSVEQMGTMVSSIFSQLYEQRAAASLSKIFMRSKELALLEKQSELATKIGQEVDFAKITGTITAEQSEVMAKAAMEKLPQLKSFEKAQSALSMGLSLGYMAMSTTSDIYGQAITGGYDKRSAGFATLLAAAGQYGIMMNNRMGHWFLDKSTGYTEETNKAMLRKAVLPYMEEIQTGFKATETNMAKGKFQLAGVVSKFKNTIEDIFTTPSIIGENMWKNAVIEGVEEVTEQAVQDMSTGVVDLMSYLGWTEKKGSMNTWDDTFSAQGFQKYLSNLVGGVIGGAMFEYQRSVIEPLLDPKNSVALTQDTKKDLYQLIADGHTEEIIAAVNKQRKKLGNKYITPEGADVENNVITNIGDNVGDSTMSNLNKNYSQADVVADETIRIIQRLDGIFNSTGLGESDDEVIRKTMLDSLILDSLKKSKEEGKTIGIEGIILSDYTEKINKIHDIVLEIEKLKQSETDTLKNTKQIQKLKEESSIYEKQVKEMLDGNTAEKYFDQMSMYLNKQISDKWVVIDKDTFTKITYGKNYHDLEPEGFGVTQKRIDDEFKKYKENTDFKKYLGVATEAYKQLELDFNPKLVEYMTNGYSYERDKTFKGLLDISRQLELWNMDPEHREANLEQFRATVNNIEQKIGKKIVSWDVIKTNVAKKVIDHDVLINYETGKKLTEAELNQVVNAESGTTKKEFIDNFISTIASYLPSEAIDYDVLLNTFNAKVVEYDQQIDQQINQLITQLDSADSIQKVDIEKQMKELDDKKLKVNLMPYEQTETAQNQIITNNLNLKTEQADLQLTDADIDFLTNTPNISTNVSSIKDLYANKAKVLGKSVNDLSNTEKYEALLSVITLFNNYYKNNDIKELINNDDIFNLTSILESFLDYFNSIKNKLNKYQTLKNKLEFAVKTPQFFQINDYGLEEIVKEIKQSKNLDRELVILIEQRLDTKLSYIKANYFKELQLTNVELLDLIENSDKILGDLEKIQNELSSDTEDLETVLQKYNLPKYISLDHIELLDSVGDLLGILHDFKNFKNTNKDYFNTLTELKEITDNKNQFISNSIYDFLSEKIVPLLTSSGIKKLSIFDILKNEELSLFQTSNISNYLIEGIRTTQISNAIDMISLLESVVEGTSLTEVDFEHPSGFIVTRQKFLERNKITSPTTSLKTVPSDIAALMLKDLARIKVKLETLKELSKSNSGKIYNESELTRTATSNLVIKELKEILRKPVIFKEKPTLPDLTDLLTNLDDKEGQLLNIRSAIYQYVKDLNLNNTELIQLFTQILTDNDLLFKNNIDSIYNIDGTDEITKDVKELSRTDFVWILASTMVLNPKDVNNKFLAQAKMEGFNKVPFYSQELAAEILYASTVNPELFSAIVKLTTDPDLVTTDFISYVLGNAGTGKTSVIFKSLITFLMNNNPNLTIWLAGPKLDQADLLETNVLEGIDTKQFTINKYNKSTLFDKLGISEIINDINSNKDKSQYVTVQSGNSIILNADKITIKESVTNLPDLLFIDEVTHFTALELGVINEIAKKAWAEGKLIKIVGAGDQSQNGAKFFGASFNVDRVSGIFTPFINLVVRAENSQKREDNDYVSSLVRKSIKHFNDYRVDSSKIMGFIDKGILLKYYLDDKTLCGDLITTDKIIPTKVLTALVNIIKENPKSVIGILTDSGTLNPNIQEQLTKANISMDNVKLFTQDNIQGSEVNYFIFKTSQIKSNHILGALRNLYTYMSRSKSASIIINDESINNTLDSTTLNLISTAEDFPNFITPINEDLVKETKLKRIEKLTKLLDPNFSLVDDNFKFKKDAVIEEADEISPEVSISGKPDDEVNHVVPQPQVVLNNKLKTKPDDNKFMLHTFYNDINVKFTIVDGDKVLLEKNDRTNLNSGLSFIFGLGENQKVISKDEFDKLTSSLVSLKYSFWNLQGKLPANNEIMRLVTNTEAYIPNHYSTKLVLINTKYDELANAPFAKGMVDNSSKHLKNDDNHVNLYLKVNISPNNDYYIHLATFGALDTVAAVFGKDSNSIKTYEKLLTSAKSEVEVKFEDISIISPTRITTQGADINYNKLKRLTLTEISKIPGISFYNRGVFTNEIHYELFSTNKAKFIEEIEKFNFGEPRKDEDVDDPYNPGKKILGLESLYKKFRGKPYAAVTFIEDPKQVQLILLKSRRRYIKEIKQIVIDEVLIDKLTNSNTQKQAETLRDSLFSGSQVLDKLIEIATENSELYIKLFKQGKVSEDESTEFIKAYTDSFKDVMKKDIISLITNEKDSKLRLVIETLLKTVEDFQSKHMPLDRKLLRDELLKLVRSTNTQWYRNFWNIFELYRKSAIIASNEKYLPEIRGRYKEINSTLGKIFSVWEAKESDKAQDGSIFFNVPIVSAKGSTGPEKYERVESPLVFDNVYTTIMPEGPRLLIDLSTKSSVIKPETIIKKTEEKTDALLTEMQQVVKPILPITKEVAIAQIGEILTPIPGYNDLSEVQKLVSIFKDKLSDVKESDNADDNTLFEELLKKWKTKVFPSIDGSESLTLSEFLNHIKDLSVIKVNEFLAPKHDVGIESNLMNYVLDKLQIDFGKYKNNESLEDFFEC